MRISDWSSDVCSSDLTRIDDELAYHPGSRRPRRKGGFVALARQCGAQFINQHYSGPLRPDHDFRAVLPLFSTDIELSSPTPRLPGTKREVTQYLGTALEQNLPPNHPTHFYHGKYS